ncbi:hypothetical protein NC651_010093 [Populus alba x Populus x berolinensis]|nr:hypothetical protein NC651_010093 [Populus alba x Populus x berolinensis]
MKITLRKIQEILRSTGYSSIEDINCIAMLNLVPPKRSIIVHNILFMYEKIPFLWKKKLIFLLQILQLFSNLSNIIRWIHFDRNLLSATPGHNNHPQFLETCRAPF